MYEDAKPPLGRAGLGVVLVRELREGPVIHLQAPEELTGGSVTSWQRHLAAASPRGNVISRQRHLATTSPRGTAPRTTRTPRQVVELDFGSDSCENPAGLISNACLHHLQMGLEILVTGYFVVGYSVMARIIVLALIAGALSLPEAAIGQIHWYTDPLNPHLSWYTVLDPSVVYDSSRQVFELWSSTGYNVIRATSPDGRFWTERENSPGEDLTSTFGIKRLHGVEVVRVDTTYFMYYTGHGWDDKIRIGLATSPDGDTWTRHPASPVIDTGSEGTWESLHVWYPKVVKVEKTFYMIYGGYDGIIAQVGVARSPDGITWEKYSGNPVVVHGLPSAPDANGAGPGGLSYKDGMFYLLYTSRSGTDTVTLSLATSVDCVTWLKYAENPVLGPGAPGTWDAGGRHEGTLRFAEGAWHYWYSGTRDGSSWKLGYASSAELPVSVEPQAVALPPVPILHQNYPNPFNPSTTIRYELPVRSHVTLTVFNTLGQQVAMLVEGEMEAGYHEVKFDASNLSSGVYLYQLRAGAYVETRKLIHVK